MPGSGSKSESCSTGEEHVFRVHTVVVRIDIDPNEPERHDDRFRLFSEDGSYDATLTVQDDQVPGDKYLDLRFTGTPTTASFSLEVDEGTGGGKYLLLENVPYQDLLT
jgi:hypothetical protein